MMRLRLPFFLILICCTFTVRAQDSTRAAKLDKQLSLLQQWTAERTADSLKRAALEQQVAALSTNDRNRRAELEQQLLQLRKADSLKSAGQRQKIDSLRRFVKGFAVAPFRDTLFRIYARQGSFTAAERAEAVATRILKLDDLPNFKADSLKSVPGENTTDLVYGDQLLVSVSTQDALWEKTTPVQLAGQMRIAVVKAIMTNHAENSWQEIGKEIGLALLVITLAIALIVAINRLFRWLIGRRPQQRSWLSHGLRIRNYTLLGPERLGSLFLSALNVVRWCVIILVIYLALPAIFRIFPFTRELSAQLTAYVLDPLKKIGHSVWLYIPNLFTILVLVIVFRLILRLLRYLKTEVERGVLVIPGFYADWANPTYQIVRILVLAFLLIVIFPYLPGSDSAVFKGVSVFMGVLFTFGSAGALGNVVAGLVMTYMRAFKVGDRVTIGEATGDIVEKTLLVTRIRTIQNEVISIPNSTVMSNHTINFSSEAINRGLILHTSVTIGYDAPWRQVHALLIAAAKATPMIEAEPEPYVLQTGLDDYYVAYRLNAYTKEPNKQALIYSQLHQNIQDQFNAAGVEIMSPHYRAVRDGNTPAMPPPADSRTNNE